MLKMNKQVYERHIKGVISRVADVLFDRKPKRSMKYASKFVDRVKTVLNKYGEEGCVRSNFTPHFKLEEADIVDFTLHALWKRNMVIREVRYFIRPTK